MCYNSCEHFHFNPMTGDDWCSKRKSDICPMSIDDEELEDEYEPEPEYKEDIGDDYAD